MITEQDLQEAIAECQGQRNPSANTCIKLAAFYTIRRELFGEGKDAAQLPGYSFLPEPSAADSMIRNPSDSEFARTIDGRKQEEIWPLMDEMMETIQAIHPRLYRAVMERLR
ncbi:MAG: hypothetical protein J6Y48_16035 [Clostridia bacterium]|nr:hypothetical protein [Clostridia bacterium]